MKYFYWIVFLCCGWISCQSPIEEKITIDDIKDSSNRTLVIPKEESVTFFDANQQVISPDKFNQLLAEGIYLSEQKFRIDGLEEVHLISITDHAKKLEEQRLPSFELQDLNGNIHTENSLKGKVSVLSFWFTASMVCTNEIEQLNTLVGKHNKNQDFLWLAPALDNTADLSRFLKDKGWHYDFAANQEDLALKLGILTYPTHLVINKDGDIVKAIVRHPKAKEVIENTIQQLL